MFFYIAILLLLLPLAGNAAPEDDRLKLHNYFLEHAPAIPLQSYASDYHPRQLLPSGAPLYADLVRKGKSLFNSNFNNGRQYAACFRSNGIGIATDYPYYDVIEGRIVTLSRALNDCRMENNELAYAYDDADIEAIITFIMSTSDRNIVNVIMPNDQAAEAAFNEGKRLFFARQGQLNMACAHCHIDYADKRYGREQIPPALGLPLRMPRYDSENEELVTLHERFNVCLNYTQAKPYPLEGEKLQALEFYLFYVNNSLPLNAPSSK